jgi:enoyl-CoA hydratase
MRAWATDPPVAGVLLEEHEAIALVTINPPEERNALSIETRFEIAKLFETLAGDEAKSGVVITGTPPAFCAGMDTTQFGGNETSNRALRAAAQDGPATRAYPPS